MIFFVYLTVLHTFVKNICILMQLNVYYLAFVRFTHLHKTFLKQLSYKTTFASLLINYKLLITNILNYNFYYF